PMHTVKDLKLSSDDSRLATPHYASDEDRRDAQDSYQISVVATLSSPNLFRGQASVHGRSVESDVVAGLPLLNFNQRVIEVSLCIVRIRKCCGYKMVSCST